MTGSLTRRDPAKDPLGLQAVPHIVMDPPRHRSLAMPPYRALLQVGRLRATAEPRPRGDDHQASPRRDRRDLIALALAEDAAWSGVPAVAAEEAGEFIGQFGLGLIVELFGRVAGYAAIGEGGGNGGACRSRQRPRSRAGGARRSASAAITRSTRTRATRAGSRGSRPTASLTGAAHSIWTAALTRRSRRRSWPSAVTVARYALAEEDDAVHALVYVDAAWGEVRGARPTRRGTRPRTARAARASCENPTRSKPSRRSRRPDFDGQGRAPKLCRQQPRRRRGRRPVRENVRRGRSGDHERRRLRMVEHCEMSLPR
jgi:hypothetical protein